MMMLPSPLSHCYFITQAHDTWTLEEDILQDIRDKAREKVSTVFKSLWKQTQRLLNQTVFSFD